MKVFEKLPALVLIFKAIEWELFIDDSFWTILALGAK